MGAFTRGVHALSASKKEMDSLSTLSDSDLQGKSDAYDKRVKSVFGNGPGDNSIYKSEIKRRKLGSAGSAAKQLLGD